MNNFTKSIVYSGVVLAAGLVAVFAIYNNMSNTNSDYSYIEPASGSQIDVAAENAVDMEAAVQELSADAVTEAQDAATEAAENAEEAAQDSTAAIENAAEAAQDATAAAENAAEAAQDATVAAEAAQDETIEVEATEPASGSEVLNDLRKDAE